MNLAQIAVDFASATVIVGPFTILWLCAVGDRRRAGIIAVSQFGALSFNLGLKHLFHRTRPGEASPAYLFPSTHMLLTVVTYGMLASAMSVYMRAQWRWTIACTTTCLIACVGLSLVYLDDHYLTDVIGGLLIGSPWLRVSLAILDGPVLKSRWSAGRDP